MSDAKTLTFYLNTSMRARAEAGNTNIINRICNAFKSRGYQCLFQGNTATDLINSARDPGYSMFHMEDPFHPRALNLRRAYYYPFWSIEASTKRWDWRVAKARYDPGQIDGAAASQFATYWKSRNFSDTASMGPSQGYIFMPLQGRLLDQRSFQTMAPLDMIRATLQADPERQIFMSLHPRETYSDLEMDALNELVDQNPRLQLASSQSNQLVRGCDYVVTQNSSLVLDGYFHHKPAVLFGRIDFHHIARKVADLGVAQAFAQVLANRSDFDGYLFWFLQIQAINAGRDDAEARILASVRGHGWDL